MGDYWSDYNRGASGLPPRDGMFYNMAERAGYDASFSNNNNGSGSAGGGLGALVVLCAALAAIVAIAAAAAVSAIAALPCAYLLIWITRAFSPSDAPEFLDAYKASFLGFAISLVIAGGILFAITQGAVVAGGLGYASLTLLFGGLPASAWTGPVITALAIDMVSLLLPGVIVFALILGNRIGAPYTGGVGILRAFVAALGVLVVPALALGALALVIAPYAEPAVTRSSEIADFIGVVLLLVALVAAVGGVVLAGLLIVVGGGLAKGGPMFRSAWFVSAVAMALTAGSAAVAIYLFRAGDPGLQSLIALVRPVRGALPLSETWLGLFKLVAPGALAGAFFVAGNLYAYRGLLGWAKAIAVTVPVCLAGFGGAVMALAQLR
jgi:hypothetical protein